MSTNTIRINRRLAMQSVSCGFAYLVLQAISRQANAEVAGSSTSQTSGGLAAGNSPLAARAKRVIFLCMSGGPAHLDTFDYKPQTGQKNTQDRCSPSNNAGRAGSGSRTCFLKPPDMRTNCA